VDLSPAFHAGLWWASRALGYPPDRAGLGVEARGQVGARWPAGHVVGSAGLSAARAGGALDSGQVRARLTLVAQRGAHTAILHGELARMLGARPPGVFDLWLEQRGPRLFPPHAFVGERTWWVALENRALVHRALAGHVAVAIAGFVEVARGEGRTGADGGGNAGAALRLVPLRFATRDVVEVAVGYRFGEAVRRPGWALGIRRAYWF
jgi:hypothetical protein